MLSAQDKDWLKRVSDSKKVQITAYDPGAEEIFTKQKQELTDILGEDIEILHTGSSGLKLPGQDEIDVVVLVALRDFDGTVADLAQAYGPAETIYPQVRARFNRVEQGKKIEVFVMSKESDEWIRMALFEEYLKRHPKALMEYKAIKEASRDVSLRKYYRRKISFINDIVKKATST